MTLAWFFWDPKIEVFRIPIIDRPIVWYGVLFTLGFILGYIFFYILLKRYFETDPKLIKEDINGSLPFSLKKFSSTSAERILKGYSLKNENIQSLLTHLNNYIDKARSFEGKLELRQGVEKAFSPYVRSLKKKTLFVADKFTTYIVLATIIGARLFHVFFYEKPSFYLTNPLKIFAVWEGGLASHGAAVAIFLAIFLFARNYRYIKPKLDALKLLDLVAIPTLCAAVFIRLGNFSGQEILGTKTSLPWAVIFGHPADLSMPAPRHPVTLYESGFYFLLLILFVFLTFKTKLLEKKGRSIALFFILVFSFRFFIEFFKEKQSNLFEVQPFLTMGQWLSIPLVIFGVFLLIWVNRKGSRTKKNHLS